MTTIHYKPRRKFVLPDEDLAPTPVRVWSKEDNLICPWTKTEAFAQVPELHIRGVGTTPAGPLYLRYGEHFGHNRGFGFLHTWKEHFRGHGDERRAMDAVCAAFELILVSGTEIYFDPDRSEKKHPHQNNRQSRPVVFRVGRGVAVIEYRQEGFYSIITGGYLVQNTKGSLVGALA